MNIVDSIKIEGLWGRPDPLIVKFDENYNFLIGQNGTGKTTLINLLAAALTADFEKLDRIDYSRIEIKLKMNGSRKRPVIEILRTQKSELPYFDIKYVMRATSTSKPITFDFDRFEEERFFRGLPPRLIREKSQRRFYDVRQQLKSLFSVRWLSINRANDEMRPDDDRKFPSMVDKKVSEMTSEIVKYLGRLTKAYADQTTEFQQSSLLSLIGAESEFKLNEFQKSINIEEEKAALEKAFELLGVAPNKYQKIIKTHFENYTSATNKMGQGGISISELGSIYNALKAHYLVLQYNSLQERRLDIFAPRDNFLRIFNKLLAPRKFLKTSVRGELEVYMGVERPVNDKVKPLLFEDLSSGEKQLFIILGEALLMESQPAIYIADEPELSLHVTWQEQLTFAIKSINPNAQIIFATHSPDIVGSHSENLIDMERIGR